MRTTLDLDSTVLEQFRERCRREGKTLGQLASELLAIGLAGTGAPPRTTPLAWSSQPMGARVDLEDRDAVARVLDEPR